MIYIPSILDIVMPLNVTRVRTFPIDVEYFIDQNEYYYAISCHIIISLIFNYTTTLGTESLYLMYVCHVCGMFKITCYRLRHAFDQYALRASSTVAKRTAIHMRIIEAIQIHKRALELV
ncbi:uncharacterized protein LOC116845920 [Odontomachus brunneus]|uniref:uncharacterized protein LOC116845920 n=1 Tax=Odontomachus brunneus TaxID=486640 RepID=UPI0013F245D7|nr:uncharacterized protein LOC116845920 [Odontomachus brunneus]